ncbi:type II toxin-antitoxin system VapB family antitoxin [Georgenia deserti]|uniref:Type II toxin-antitoxin system VapB family antitoxin n=1 Tax=Georgenia deserti TaxID=2093781 RepID=A0ABW4L3D9_9MICO
MSLNIKNERVHALAREAARVTGTSQTSAIETALERLLAEHGVDLARAERDRRIAEILDISRSWNPRAGSHDVLASDEDLYDAETGLPA